MLVDSLFVHTFMLLIISESIYGCRFGTGPNCAFPCNCNNNGCDEETGDCTDYGGCRSALPAGYGWGGPGCLIGNLAFHKPSFQSSEFNRWKFPAYIGNDGDNNCVADHYTHTGKETPVWYRVDLGSRFKIINITVYDRELGTLKERLIGSQIQIINGNYAQDCATITNANYRPVITFECTMVGDAVRLYRDLPESIMHICEMVVFGHPFIAPTSECDEWENDVLGCRTCQNGRLLPGCAEDCPSGYYGVNCQNLCSTNCKSGQSPICDPLSGRCTGRCQGWYVGDKCDTEIYELEIHNRDVLDETTPSSITITWKAATSPSAEAKNYYHYIIRYRKMGGSDMATPAIPLVDEMASKQSYTISNLEQDTVYEYLVRIVRTVDDKSDFYDSSLIKASTLRNDDSSGVTGTIISEASSDISTMADILIPSKFTDAEWPDASANEKTCAKLCALEERSVLLINAAISMMVVSVIIAIVAVAGAILYVKRARQEFQDKTSVQLPYIDIAHTATVTPTASSAHDDQRAEVNQNRYRKQSTVETGNTQYYNMRSQNGIVDYEDVDLAVGLGSYEQLTRTNVPPVTTNAVYQTLD